MALTRVQKSAQLQGLKESLTKAKSVVFVHFSGIKVGDASMFRRKLGERKAMMKVAKKTLFHIAARELGYPEMPETAMDGPVGFIFSFEDEISGAKVALEFGRTNEAVKLIGGILNGEILSKAEAIEFAKILSREQLLAQFAMMLQAPLSNFASMSNAPLGGFARGLKQVADKKVP